jgi:UDP-3-O-[3-hydroxymyristoyl] N-acetylglucosamine deacetylase/3-hydroxyacyl-[acyl-carrier-protein] dehydratase
LNQQQTIEREVELTGRGLFTGFPVRVRFKPAPAGSGITFVRTDGPDPVRVVARIDNLSKRARRTSLKNGTVTIETIEHCLAALQAFAIDNVEVELDNAELPSGDGSCLPFTDSLASAGAMPQDGERKYLHVLEVTRVSDGDSELVAWPGSDERLDIYYELDYGRGNPVGQQTYHFVLDRERFVTEIAPSRTFVLEEEARQLREAGLGQHLTYQDVLVIGPNGPIENTYRFPDECVRHKVLDVIGDLMLSGAFICGRIFARRSGHHLNHELVRRLLEQHASQNAHQALSRRPRLDIEAVQRILPHRYPMLLVDRVVEIDGDRRAVGIKNVSINEPFFQGHYPRKPIMPGVLIIEAMAQLGGLLLSQKLEHTGKVAVLLSLDGVKFRRPVVPGDQLSLEAQAIRVKSRTGEVFCQARVASELAAEANIRFMLVDADPS